MRATGSVAALRRHSRAIFAHPVGITQTRTGMGASYGVPCPMEPPSNLSRICEVQGHLPLNRALLLGAHNAGSFAMSDESEVSPDAHRLTQTLQGIPGIGGVMKSAVRNWGCTQGVDCANMLHLGVRYFDLRLWFSPTSKRWLLVHGLAGDSLSRFVADVNNFLADFPSEVVVMYVKSLQPALENLEVEAVDALEHTFLRLPLLLASSFSANMPLSEIPKMGNVILALEDHDKDIVQRMLPRLGALGYTLPGKSFICDPWGNCSSVERLESFLLGNDAAQKEDKDDVVVSMPTLHVTQLILSPSEDDIKRGVMAMLNIDKLTGSDYPRSLHSVVHRNRPQLMDLGRRIVAESRRNSLATATGGDDAWTSFPAEPSRDLSPSEICHRRVNIILVDFAEKFHTLLAHLAVQPLEVLKPDHVYEIQSCMTQTVITVASHSNNTKLFAAERNGVPPSAATCRFRAVENMNDGTWTFVLAIQPSQAIDDSGETRKPCHMWTAATAGAENINQRFMVRAAGNGSCTVHCKRDVHAAWDVVDGSVKQLAVTPFSAALSQKFVFIDKSQ